MVSSLLGERENQENAYTENEMNCIIELNYIEAIYTAQVQPQSLPYHTQLTKQTTKPPTPPEAIALSRQLSQIIPPSFSNS